MAIGNKIAAARKRMNLTQDQLAEMLDVTRQSVSRWESETAYPETEKLVKLSKILELDLNYLLDEEATENNYKEKTSEAENKNYNFLKNLFGTMHYEYKSKRTVKGLPLVHINMGLDAYKAKGIIAIGNSAFGLVSIGLASFGIFSIGLFSLGLLSIGLVALGAAAGGTIAIGILAAGAISLGVIAFGAIAVGMMSVGALSIGLFSCGAMSYGKYVAIGDRAIGDIAIGMTSAVGKIFESFSGVANTFAYDRAEVLSVIDANVPAIWSWLAAMFKIFI